MIHDYQTATPDQLPPVAAQRRCSVSNVDADHVSTMSVC
jgi:hypothetical protein